MKPIYFEITYNGIKVSKTKFTIPKYTLPAKDWLVHNQMYLNDKNMQIFTFIRNPLERVILQYKHQIKHRPALRQYPMSFKEWCKASFNDSNVDKFMQNNPKEFLSQKKWIEGFEDKNLGVFILDKDFKFSGVNFKKLNIEDYYDVETEKLIKFWYADDYNLINEYK